MWKPEVGYGALLAVGTLAISWLDYQRLARMHSGDLYLFLIAVTFLVLSIVLGVGLFAAPAPIAFDGNPKAQSALGLSERELVLAIRVSLFPLPSGFLTKIELETLTTARSRSPIIAHPMPAGTMRHNDGNPSKVSLTCQISKISSTNNEQGLARQRASIGANDARNG